jgi:hypothetical protein
LFCHLAVDKPVAPHLLLFLVAMMPLPLLLVNVLV